MLFGQEKRERKTIPDRLDLTQDAWSSSSDEEG